MAEEEKEDITPEEKATPDPDDATGQEAEESMESDEDPGEIAADEGMLAAMAEEQQLADEAALEDLHKSLDQSSAEQEMHAVSDDQVEKESASNIVAVNTANLNLLIEVGLQISVELGRRDMSFGDILQLGRGSVVELNKLADEPVDIYVNQSKIAEGEVVVVDEHFGVRITRLISSERLKKIG